MKKAFTTLIACGLLLASAANAALPATHSGYFASAQFSVIGSYPTEYWSQSVGPYLTYGDCYDAWMEMTHNFPSIYWLESTVPCHLVSTHMAYAEPHSLMINDDGDDESGPTKFRSLDEIVDYVDRVGELRRQFNIDAYEAAAERLR